jgi:hypothetical protein
MAGQAGSVGRDRPAGRRRGECPVRRLGLAALIAIVLAVPTITTAWSGNARIVTLAAALSGVAGGIIAAFGIQRSL